MLYEYFYRKLLLFMAVGYGVECLGLFKAICFRHSLHYPMLINPWVQWMSRTNEDYSAFLYSSNLRKVW